MLKQCVCLFMLQALSLANREVITTTVPIRRRDDGNLGLSIAGGRGSATTFLGDDDDSIFVSKVAEAGPAEKAGLAVGDKVLAVNGISVIEVEHQTAVELLKNAGVIIVLLVERMPREVCNISFNLILWTVKSFDNRSVQLF